MPSDNEEEDVEGFEDCVRMLNSTATFSARCDAERKYQKKFPEILKKRSPKATTDHYKSLLIAALKNGEDNLMEIFAEKILDKRNLVNWKERPDILDDCFRTIYECEYDPDYCRDHQDVIEKMVKVARANKQGDMANEWLMKIIHKALNCDEEDHTIHRAAMACAKGYPWKMSTKEEVIPVYDLLVEQIKRHSEISTNHFLYYSAFMIVVMTSTQLQRSLMPNITPHLAEILNVCKNKEFVSDEDSDQKTMSFEMIKNILSCYRIEQFPADCIKKLLSHIRDIWECGDQELEEQANSCMSSISPDIMDDDDGQKMVDAYFSGEQPHIISKFSTMYPTNPELFDDRVDDFVEKMQVEDPMVTCIVQLLWEIAKKNTDAFSENAIKGSLKMLDHKIAVHMALMLFATLAEKRPDDVQPHDEKIMSTIQRLGAQGLAGNGVLVSLSKTSEKHAAKYLDFFSKQLQTADVNGKLAIVYHMRSIGQNFLPPLTRYRVLFEDMLSTESGSVIEACQSCIDLIEGRSLETVSKDVADQRLDMAEMDDRIDATEENVKQVKTEVSENREKIGALREDVDRQEERLDDLEEVVDETTVKVEELDHKTLSHAPAWSRDVAVLINVDSDADWRLLSQRLGYTNDDIRNWATQPNPALSMFDEWFATHKTREATHAIQKNLEEMNRIDAAEIVERALAMTENVVEDSEDEDMEPPPVFISYQWGHQQEVKLLRKHLELSGYKAWMDVGQMGGGDKLYAKIDTGIRAAKVIVCCVSEKYAQSPNCNKEVNLAVTLGKPIIPLLMEKLAWPPPGTMGPIFSEYIFIRFFQRQGEQTADNRFWPEPKFSELLMQLRFTMPPDESLISPDSMYKDWWNPPEEIIEIDKKANTQSSTSKKKTNDSADTLSSPDVFISYQWGRQTQIKALYKRLTRLGFTCWLDIMQMGGGDSLFDKIDKGIRGCKVIISCVTSKYALSANCRREVSLADAIKKPIIPVLLEKMTWPPEGPMGMVFTQLLYIQFFKDPSVQEHWNCPQFDELLAKIQVHVPINNPSSAIEQKDQNAGSTQESERKPSPISDTKPSNHQEKAEENLGGASRACTIL